MRELLFEVFEEKERMKTLFDEPLSHRDDPVTSYLAAQGYAQCGQWRRDCRVVLYALLQHNGSTSAELANFMDVDRHMPARRLPDLRDMYKVVRNGPNRKCRIRHKLSFTWFIK